MSRRTEYVHARSGEDVPPEDGYSWRKYGQKLILGAKYPRLLRWFGEVRQSHQFLKLPMEEVTIVVKKTKNPNGELVVKTKETQSDKGECDIPEMVSTPNNSFDNSSTGVYSSLMSLEMRLEEALSRSRILFVFLSSLGLGACEIKGIGQKVYSYTSMKKIARRTEYVQARTGEEVPPEDGYSWRKYGQKDILGAKYPREYYRCGRRGLSNCAATKMVQKSETDPSIFEVTYGGSHGCGQENKNQNEEQLRVVLTEETQYHEVGRAGEISEPYFPKMVSTPNSNSFNNSSTGVVFSNSNSLFNITNSDFISTPTSSPHSDWNFSNDDFIYGPGNDSNLLLNDTSLTRLTALLDDVPENCSHTYRGVHQHPSGKWAAEIRETNGGTRICLGTFETRIDAARVYDAEAYKLYGENAKLNFPHRYIK
ncbi:hypothetical protein RND71_026210 [Anisodus tanguticus]|uniref:Uncharacterized protein n=1 Tax=Anisodus tanguticus TaxID=243964 RepID=A0AAE1RLW8_9SOLA|nr:hypothetical protein RND71_026210 [Anisodus tanguticus]